MGANAVPAGFTRTTALVGESVGAMLDCSWKHPAVPNSRAAELGCRAQWRSPALPSLLEPLLILRHFLPALVRQAGADQAHVGAEVAAVLPVAIAWILWLKAKL